MEIQPHLFPKLTTARLILRQLTGGDDEAIFAFRSDDRIGKYLDRKKCESLDEARQFIQKVNGLMDRQEWIYWGVALKSDPALIGTICLWNISPEQRKAEIGYELWPDYQGKGYMQEAVTAVLDHGFNTLRLDQIDGVVDPENARSIRMLEKNGFSRISNTEAARPAEESGTPFLVYRLQNRSR